MISELALTTDPCEIRVAELKRYTRLSISGRSLVRVAKYCVVTVTVFVTPN